MMTLKAVAERFRVFYEVDLVYGNVKKMGDEKRCVCFCCREKNTSGVRLSALVSACVCLHMCACVCMCVLLIFSKQS